MLFAIKAFSQEGCTRLQLAQNLKEKCCESSSLEVHIHTVISRRANRSGTGRTFND